MEINPDAAKATLRFSVSLIEVIVFIRFVLLLIRLITILHRN